MGSPGTGMLMSLKTALALGAVVATTAAVLVLPVVPSIRRLLAAEVPRAYASLLAWLTPPYLYFVLNAIIICIAASSRLQHKSPAHAAEASPPVAMASHRPDYVPPVRGREYDDIGDDKAIVLDQEGVPEKEEETEQEFVTPRSSWSAESLAVTEKPLVSGRFSHRKNLKSGHEDKALRRVAKPRREETLESTWRAITEGRAVPLARHLKKADTWNTRSAREDAAAVVMQMSETFSDDEAIADGDGGGGGGGGGSSPPSWTSSGVGRARVRREPSLGQEELNRRVEAFIEKFNDEMRLQRQKSLQQFMETMNPGSQ